MSKEEDTLQDLGHDGGWIMHLASEVAKLAESGVSDATETVLESRSDVDVDDELIMSLLYEEILALEKKQGAIQSEGLIARFPNLKDRINRLIAFHESLKVDDSVHFRETDGLFSQHDTLNTSPFPEPMTELCDGQFEILEKIGQGGMGVVYRARQKDLNRLVALKLLRSPLLDPVENRRMMNEAQAVAKLNHPGIVQIHSFGEVDGRPYLCFEFVDGVHLDERLRRSTIAPDEACRLLAKITNAVSFAHEFGIVHRDLKPGNILMDSVGEPKVADFGLAKFVATDDETTGSGKLTQTDAILGTLCYLAPEQLTGFENRFDHRTDIYGLGGIFYEMLVGRPPFMGDTPDETMYQVATQEPVAPRKINPKIPRDVETICLKCLEKEPKDRFQSTAELKRELQRYMNGEPLSIRRAGPLTVAWKWCKRRPAIAMLSALSTVLLFALAIGGYTMAWNIAQSARELKTQRDLAQDSEKLARSKAAEAEAASQFMIRTLGSAHPERDGRKVTIAEQLDDGLREIEESYPEHSTTKAALLSAIGKTFKGLGLYRDSLSPLQTAWEIFTERIGPDSADALIAETDYGIALQKLGRYDQANARLKHARAELSEQLGENDVQTLIAFRHLAENTFDRGEREQGLAMFADCYERAKAALAPLHKTTISTARAYANALIQSGRIKAARRLVAEILPRVTQAYGTDNLTVIDLKGLLASADMAESNFSAALSKYVEIHAALTELLGENHVKTLISWNGVGVCYLDMGKHERAIEVFTQVKNRMNGVFGEFHPQTLRTILNLARAMEALDRHQDAMELIRTTYERSKQLLGSNHHETMMMASHYGGKLAEENELERAEELLTQAVDYFRNQEMVEPIIRTFPFVKLATLYRRTNRAVEAIELQEQVVTMTRAAFGDLNPATLTAKNNLAGAYNSDYQSDQAISLYQEVLRDLKIVLGPENHRTLKTGINLAIIFRDAKRPQDAIEVLMEVVPILQRLAPGSWVTSTAEFQLGRAYLDNQQPDSAEGHLETAYENYHRLLHQQSASQRIGLGNQLRTIIKQFKDLEQPEMAEKWEKRREFLHNQ